VDTKSLSERPWLLLPGTLCTGVVFRAFLDALDVPQVHRLHIDLEHPSVDDYCEVLAEAPHDAVVCGFSLGAIVAAHQAHYIRAHSLVLFGLNPHEDDPAKWQGRVSLRDDVQRWGGAGAMCARRPQVFGPAPQEARDTIYRMADRAAHLIDAQTKLAITRPGALPTLSHATSQVMCLTGSRDTAAPPTQGRSAAAQAPNGQFCVLDGLGHFALLEDPQACANAVRDLHEVRYDYDYA